MRCKNKYIQLTTTYYNRVFTQVFKSFFLQQNKGQTKLLKHNETPETKKKYGARHKRHTAHYMLFVATKQRQDKATKAQ